MDDKGVWVKFGRNQEFRTLISQDQVERIKGKLLHKNSNGYVLIDENRKTRMLSHFVSGTPPKNLVKDHINHDILDNRNSNLRNVSKSENAQNIAKRSNGTSSYKGVSEQKNCGKWRARAAKLDILFSGSFDTEIEAAKAYDKFCWRLYPDSMTKDLNNNLLTDGEIEFAKNNDPPLPPRKAKEQTLLRGVINCGTYYRVSLTNKVGKVQHFGVFNSIQAANQKAKEIQNEVANAKRTKLENMPVTMNEIGEAFIIASKKSKNPTRVLVDTHLWHKISQYSWHITPEGYAKASINARQIYLHRFVWNTVHDGESIPENWVVDHINGNRIDCRSENLRILSSSENAHNRKKRKECSSSFVGVQFLAKYNKWYAYCKKKYIGTFNSEEEAAKAHQEAALHFQIVTNDCTSY